MNKTRILTELGFREEKEDGGFYTHKFLDEHFDFSATSIEGIPHDIFKKGYDVGKEQVRTEIKKVLGIKEEIGDKEGLKIVRR